MARIGTLELKGIVKAFGGQRANDGVDLTVKAGEVAALLGENGAGKTTLMNILYGLYRPDAGEVLIDGRPVEIRSPKDALRLGIGMVHQHFMLVPRHSAAENVALGLEGCPFLSPGRWAADRLREFSDRYGLRVDPRAEVWQLSAGQQQRLEIAKALIKGAECLILDEPTSVLTDDEADELFAVLRRMTGEGKSVVFITHKLEEVMRISSTVTVLRRGKAVASLRTADTTKEGLAELMLAAAGTIPLPAAPGAHGPTGAPGAPAARPAVSKGSVVLSVSGLTVFGDMGVPAVRGLSFELRAGEVLGVAGVSGNGQRELAQALAGLRPRAGGRVLLKGADTEGLGAAGMRRLGLRHIPEERLRHGIVGEMSVAENAVLTTFREGRFGEGPLLDRGLIEAYGGELISRCGIRAPSPAARTGALSGGNVQKLIVGRETDGRPAVVLAAHPTYGLDIGASEAVRSRLLEKSREGSAVLLLSEDLEEVLKLSDRVAVMFEGRFAAVLENRGLDRGKLMLMMGGAGHA